MITFDNSRRAFCTVNFVSLVAIINISVRDVVIAGKLYTNENCDNLISLNVMTV